MSASVVVTKIHRRRVGRPHPNVKVRAVASRFLHFQRCWKRLPEFVQSRAESAGDIADEGVACGTAAGGAINPAAFRHGALLEYEAVGRGLEEFVAVPYGPVLDQILALPVVFFLIGYTLSGELIG